MKKFIVFCGAAVLLCGCGSKPAQQATDVKATEASSMDLPATLAAAKLDKGTQEKMFMARGLENLKNGKPVDAIRDFDEAIKQNPTDPQPYIILGETYMHLKNYDGAINIFSAASRLDPRRGDVYYFLALNYRLNGDKLKAKENAEKSFELFRDKQDAANLKKTMALLHELSIE